MKTHKAFSLIDCILEHEIKDIQSTFQSLPANDITRPFLEDDLKELILLREAFEKYKAKFLEKVLPY